MAHASHGRVLDQILNDLNKHRSRRNASPRTRLLAISRLKRLLGLIFLPEMIGTVEVILEVGVLSRQLVSYKENEDARRTCMRQETLYSASLFRLAY